MTSSSVDWSDADVLRHLRGSPVFGRLNEEALHRLSECASIRYAEAGEVLVEEGAVGDEAFIVVAGRLEVVTDGADGSLDVVGYVGPGDVVGEMALITDDPRSATVRAVRDSALVTLPAQEFRDILAADHLVLLDVTRTVMARLNRSIHGQRPDSSVTVIALLKVDDHPVAAVDAFEKDFARALGGDARVAVIDAHRAATVLGTEPSRTRVAQYLHNIEDHHEAVILVGDPSDPDWADLCRRQSDVTVLVGSATSVAAASRNGRGIGGVLGQDADEHGPTPRHLVVIHRSAPPVGTAAVASWFGVDRCHHIHADARADVERVARIVTGRSVGLVFGGGGARGFAHLGAVRAFLEAKVPVDHVGGSSIGAAVASAMASGWEWDRMVEMVRMVTYGSGSLIDTTFPAIALGRGRRLTDGIKRGTGDIQVEDLWLEFFAVSTDLTSGDVRVHADGPVWAAIRASVSIPGIFPPVRAPDGNVLVDGGVLNNLPVDVMRSMYAPSRLMAVDLRAPTALRSDDLSSDGEMSGWTLVRRRLAPWMDQMEVPRLVDLLLASSMLTSKSAAEDADVVIRPPVAEFEILDFTRSDELIEVGYRTTSEMIDAGALEAVID